MPIATFIIGCVPVPLIVSPHIQDTISLPTQESSPEMNCTSGTLLDSDFGEIDQLFHATFDQRCSLPDTTFLQRITEVTCSESATCARAICQCEIAFTPSAGGGAGKDVKTIRTADFVKKDGVWRIHLRPLD
ncbi:hypothetical protein HYW94_02865 [Candidatus Uhrbacteria bacterium]|nr:hypothetical protein [Candidatus Uhrbacteria bacterium]